MAVGAVCAGVFYWYYLRGIGPTIKQPPQDITKLIEPSQPNRRSSQNLAGMPLKLQEGFSISIFANNLKMPRVLALDPAGNILTSITGEGRVVALPDRNNDGVVDEIIVIADGLNRPHGLAFRCQETCKLYVAESDQVAVYDYDAGNLLAINKKKIIDLPDGGRHFTRTLLFMPPPNENKLLISIGSSCDVCDEKDWRRAKVLVANEDGSGLRVFANGLRNSVFMAIHPITGKVWATEMGRDFLGDNLPPDEINIIEQDEWYGWPWFYGKNIEDYNFSPYSRPQFAKEPKPSRIDIPTHSAPLGLAFIPASGWPKDYQNNLLVAYHGSWNKSEPTGYKIVRYKLDEEGDYSEEEDFISGWLAKDGDPRTQRAEQSSYDGALGRPVDILTQSNGTIYISDDKAGVIYKVAKISDIK